MNTNSELIEKLTNSQMYKDYERAYSDATDLPLALRPVETWQLPLHGKRKENPFCSMMASSSRSCAACLQIQDKLCQNARHEPACMTCPYGLKEVAVPVRLGTETIGYLQTGQVLTEKPTAARFDAAIAQFQQQNPQLKTQAARDAYLNTKVVSKKKLSSLTNLLNIFANHLSVVSNQIAVREANAESPAMVKAKQYIEDHYTEDLKLSQVAAAVFMSTFYFCKTFKKKVGVNFTEFVSRTRIEKAKNLLLNPNLRVSEIAFEVGFQSLTHFNRIFKYVTNQSPTEFRGQLPARPV
jgi:AraC-like DNA-binding protein/ligand-binding sensor protein